MSPAVKEIRHARPAASRRDFLLHAGGGFGALALVYLLRQDGLAAEPVGAAAASGQVAKPAHYRARARSVIFLFMDGGPSHIDLFDPKPELNRLAGQPLPASFKRPITPMGVSANPLLGLQAQVQAARPERPVGLRLAAAHRPPAPTTCA